MSETELLATTTAWTGVRLSLKALVRLVVSMIDSPKEACRMGKGAESLEPSSNVLGAFYVPSRCPVCAVMTMDSSDMSSSSLEQPLTMPGCVRISIIRDETITSNNDLENPSSRAKLRFPSPRMTAVVEGLGCGFSCFRILSHGHSVQWLKGGSP